MTPILIVVVAVVVLVVVLAVVTWWMGGRGGGGEVGGEEEEEDTITLFIMELSSSDMNNLLPQQPNQSDMGNLWYTDGRVCERERESVYFVCV